MPITSIQRDTNNNVSLVRMISTDSLSVIDGTDYILQEMPNINALNGGDWQWFITDMILCAAEDGNAFFQFVDDTFTTLVIFGQIGSGIIIAGMKNQLPYYSINGSTLAPLAALNSAVLATSSLGVPALTTTLPSTVQANITTVGTLGTGVWNATPITVPFGGTGNTTFTAYSVICAGTGATTEFQNVSGVGTSGQILTSNGPSALPTWQASPGSGTVNHGTQNDLAYYAATGNAVSPITTADYGVLITSGLGVPSWLANGTTGQVLSATTSGTPSWQNISYDGAVTIVYGDSGSVIPTSGAITISGGSTGLTTTEASTSVLDLTGTLNLASGGTNASLTASNGGIFYSTGSAGAILAGIATANKVLLSGVSSAPSWSTATYPANTTVSQILYSSSANVIAGLSTANNGTLVTSATGVPSILAGSGVTGNILQSNSASAPSWSTATYPSTTTINQLLYSSSANVVGGITAGNYGVLISSSAGVPSWLANGTTGQLLTATTSGIPSWANPAASSVTFTGDAGTPFAGAAVTVTGGATGLTFTAATPDLTLTGILALASGGTNANLTASNGGIFYSTATAGAILAGTATARQILLSGSSTTPAWSTATYPATTTINQLLYSSAANVVTGLATATTAVLTTAAGVPTWAAELSLGLGGTNAALVASNGGIFYSTATAGAILAGTATAGQLLTSGASTTPAWTTSTYPATNAANTLLYASAANTMAALATGNNGVLITSNSGVPSWLADGTTGQVLTATTGSPPTWANVAGTGTVNSATQYDLAYYAATGTAVSGLANGTTGQLLVATTSGAPSWTTTAYPTTNAVNTLLYASAANTMAALATADNGVLITSASGVPSWLADGTTGQVLTATTGSPPSWAAAGSPAQNYVISTTSTGTFTTASGTLTAVTNLTVTITTSGNPVQLRLQSDGTTNSSQIFAFTASAGITTAFFRGSTQISQEALSCAPGGGTIIFVPASSFSFLDTPAAGTYTYKFYIASQSGAGNAGCYYTKLVAQELI